ncbi:MAG: FAD-binding oxidoreductase [Jatrophihabitantaceae bacterium]
MNDYRNVSLWFDQLAPITARATLAEPIQVDVAIVGAGFTGLWTAYYLQAIDPTLSIAVLEAEVAGFGASGRNGGWCSALYPVSIATLAAESGPEAAIAQYLAMRTSVDEVARVTAAENIAADLVKGGTIVLARTPTQLARAQHEAYGAVQYGLDIELLDADAARERLNATNVLGATFTPHCAAIQPARLVRGLAETVERRGASIYERTRVIGFEPHVVHTDHGDVRAETIVRATEAYTARLPGTRRAVAPVYSLIIATAPLPESIWEEIGLRDRETFSDHRHLSIYGQRSAEGRLVFGGRGAPYHFGSRIRCDYDRVPRVFAALERTLGELFPMLRGTPITHRWGGPLGVARDWHASVGLDPATGIAWAGGYVGDGVSTTNLAGRTLASLITGQPSELTSLPWVGHRSRKWEPEPLRWLGANAGLQAMTWADNAENRSGKSSRLAALVDVVMSR